jgi:hypothetical protein
MAHLPNDVMLLICEHLDASSILSLMLTCRHLHHLLKSHESSITKGWISKMITNPRVAFPLGAILSSQVQEISFHELNRITLREGFEAIAEIDSRERKIDALFAQTSSGNHLGFGPLRSALDETKFTSGLSRRQTSRLVEGLKDACRIANRISDYAASALTTEEIIAARRAYILADISSLDLALLALLGELFSASPTAPMHRLEVAIQGDFVAEAIEFLLSHGIAGIFDLVTKWRTASGYVLPSYDIQHQYYERQRLVSATIVRKEESSDSAFHSEESLFRTMVKAFRVLSVEGDHRPDIFEVWSRVKSESSRMVMKWLQQ